MDSIIELERQELLLKFDELRNKGVTYNVPQIDMNTDYQTLKKLYDELREKRLNNLRKIFKEIEDDKSAASFFKDID